MNDDELTLPSGQTIRFRAIVTPDPARPDRFRLTAQSSVPVRWARSAGPAAARLADLFSVEADLAFASKCCARLATLDESEGLLDAALWRSALIAYRRCFASAVREARPATPTARELRADHEAFLALANGHIAHQIDRFESFEVFAIGNPPPDPPAVVGVHVIGVIHQVGADDQVRRLAALVDAVKATVDEEVVSARAAAMAEAQSVPPDLLFQSQEPPGPSSMAEIGQSSRTRPRGNRKRREQQ